MIIHNCHMHTFTNQHVPVGFLPLGLLRLLSRSEVGRRIGKILSGVKPGSYDDYFDRNAAFVNIGNKPTQREVFELVKGFYPDDTRFVVLPMDMEYMDAGEVPIKYEIQLDELAELKKIYHDILFPFVAVDPRRPNLLPLVQKYIEEHEFAGIKMYPPLGFFPNDSRLDPIYKYAETNQLPVMTHCSKGGVYFRGKLTETMRTHPDTNDVLASAKNNAFTEHYSHPSNYDVIMAKFPNLKLCLGHFGGDDEWRKYLATSWDRDQELSWFKIILNMLKKYDTLFTDISYSLYDTRLHPMLKILLTDSTVRNKILYGSDFYMIERDMSDRAYSMTLRAFLGEDDYRQIAETNPKAYLYPKGTVL